MRTARQAPASPSTHTPGSLAALQLYLTLQSYTTECWESACVWRGGCDRWVAMFPCNLLSSIRLLLMSPQLRDGANTAQICLPSHLKPFSRERLRRTNKSSLIFFQCVVLQCATVAPDILATSQMFKSIASTALVTPRPRPHQRLHTYYK